MKTYSVYAGRTILITFSANFANASSPIYICDPNGSNPESTPFQVADSRHNPVVAAKLLNSWLRNQGGEAWERGATGLNLRSVRGK